MEVILFGDNENYAARCVKEPVKSITYLRGYINNIYKQFNSADDVTVFYTSNFADNKYDWSYPIFRRPRTINLTSDMQKMFTDVETFFKRETEEDYAARGIPYKKGFFIEGGPGTGKSSIMEAIARKFGMSIYLMNFNSKDMNDTTLINLTSALPVRSILAFDEIEKQYDAIKKNPNIHLSIGGILSALDGPQRLSHGTIIIMTANDKSKLDDEFKTALCRKGRIDETYIFTQKFEV